jgi:hypothetical protein
MSFGWSTRAMSFALACCWKYCAISADVMPISTDPPGLGIHCGRQHRASSTTRNKSRFTCAHAPLPGDCNITCILLKRCHSWPAEVRRISIKLDDNRDRKRRRRRCWQQVAAALCRVAIKRAISKIISGRALYAVVGRLCRVACCQAGHTIRCCVVGRQRCRERLASFRPKQITGADCAR